MKRSVQNLQQLKAEQQKFSVIAAYDATHARLAADAGIDAILVGDSLGMVIQGCDSTLPVSVEDISYHCCAVASGVRQAENTPLIIADMPFMSYQNRDVALLNAAILMRAGANMVKLEGGQWLTDSVAALVDNGIPVCGHLGLTPQSVNKFGGFKVQGKSPSQQQTLLDDCRALQEAGASMLVLECIPSSLAAEATRSIDISTIGIGAGADTDAQVLVSYDLLGLSPHPARFVKNFLTRENMSSGNALLDAFKAYDTAVKNRSYPSAEHQYS